MFKGTPNQNGRPKGAKNKMTSEVKLIITDALKQGNESFLERLGSLSNRDYVRYYIELLKLIVPAPKETTGADDNLPTDIQIEIIGSKRDYTKIEE